MNMWTQQQALGLCISVEHIAQACGWHVALSGGLLYKQGTRKDCDLVMYSHDWGSKAAQESVFARKHDLLAALAERGFEIGNDTVRVVKVKFLEHAIDLLFPEIPGEYPAEETERLQ